MSAEQPDDVFDQLIIHARRTEIGQIKNDTQIVDDLFEASFARLFQTIYNKFGQFVDITGGSVMVFRWNVYHWTSAAISVLENTGFVGIV